MLKIGLILETLLVCMMIMGIKLNIKVLRNGSFTLAIIVLILTVASILINFMKC